MATDLDLKLGRALHARAARLDHGPVSRAKLPRAMLRSFDEWHGRRDFFAVAATPTHVQVVPEGTALYDDLLSGRMAEAMRLSMTKGD
jgi:hypothetical protein